VRWLESTVFPIIWSCAHDGGGASNLWFGQRRVPQRATIAHGDVCETSAHVAQ
jgi:hypothetical protein